MEKGEYRLLHHYVCFFNLPVDGGTIYMLVVKRHLLGPLLKKVLD